MSRDLTALLAAVRDDPDDELPRLALADWCLEQADEATQARGEYVHVSERRRRMMPGDPGAACAKPGIRIMPTSMVSASVRTTIRFHMEGLLHYQNCGN